MVTELAQLRLDGGADPYPPPAPKRLSDRQTILARLLRIRGELRTREAAGLYVDPSGALGRLERIGLARRGPVRGHWLPPD
jgi:hypothetical protein